MNIRRRMFNKAIYFYRYKYAKLASIDVDDKSFSKIKPKEPSMRSIFRKDLKDLYKSSDKLIKLPVIVLSI